MRIKHQSRGTIFSDDPSIFWVNIKDHVSSMSIYNLFFLSHLNSMKINMFISNDLKSPTSKFLMVSYGFSTSKWGFLQQIGDPMASWLWIQVFHRAGSSGFLKSRRGDVNMGQLWVKKTCNILYLLGAVEVTIGYNGILRAMLEFVGISLFFTPWFFIHNLRWPTWRLEAAKDVKTQNMLMDKNGTGKVTPFGRTGRTGCWRSVGAAMPLKSDMEIMENNGLARCQPMAWYYVWFGPRMCDSLQDGAGTLGVSFLHHDPV